jgi:hypothetical protein
VTEQDVINEEMYEEEDDDLPLQYRRMTANLQTNSADFNRKLQSYLTQQVAMNQAVNSAMNGQYGQQFPNQQMNQQMNMWAQQGFNPMQQQFLQQQNQLQQQQMQQQFNSQMMAAQMMHNNNQNNATKANNSNNFRQQPYPTSPFNMQIPQQAYRPVPQQRTAPVPQQNINTDNSMQAPQSRRVSPAVSQADHRRMSAPVQPPTISASPRQQGLSHSQRNSSAASLPNIALQTANTPVPTTETTSPLQRFTSSSSRASPFEQSMWASSSMDMSNPFATTLPAETQMFLGANPGGNFSNNNNFINPLSSGGNNDKSQQGFYSYNPNNFSKGRNMHPSFDGMSQTLAPGALDSSGFTEQYSTPMSASSMSNDSSLATPFNNLMQNFPDPMMGGDMNKFSQQQYNMASPMAQPNGFLTPGEAEWATFIDSSSWDETATATT